eukprot:2039574-Alexandrium_andersonii.AAC.1
MMPAAWATAITSPPPSWNGRLPAVAPLDRSIRAPQCVGGGSGSPSWGIAAPPRWKTLALSPGHAGPGRRFALGGLG